MTEQLPPDVIAQLTALGPEITPELGQASWALLKPFHEKVGYTAPAIDRDRPYGEHERHRLDVHTSGEPAGELAPVVLFAHGGGFIGGDKHVPGAPMYDHIGAWAVRNGWVGVTMTYRLAPEHTWPAGAQDVAAAVAWVRSNIAGYGGDPDRIVVVGHSAGCVHVASYLVGQGGGSLDGVRGAGLLSGFYIIGDGDARSEVGPLANQRGLRHAQSLVDDAVEAEVEASWEPELVAETEVVAEAVVALERVVAELVVCALVAEPSVAVAPLPEPAQAAKVSESAAAVA